LLQKDTNKAALSQLIRIKGMRPCWNCSMFDLFVARFSLLASRTPRARAMASAVALGLCLSQPTFAQTPALDQLKEALMQERKPNLPGAQAIYQSLLTDPDWGTAARLSLARVQRWQNLNEQAIANYTGVLASAQATPGMRDEAILGLSHIDAQELRLQQAFQRLNDISPTSPIAEQARELRARVSNTYPTRIGASYGQVHNKGGPTDASWQLKLTHQLDSRNSVALTYSSNSLQQRATQPDAPLDFVKGQLQANWRYGIPGGAGYSLEMTRRELSLGSNETSLRAQGNWPLSKTWRASAGLQTVDAGGGSSASGFAGLSTSLNKQWQLGGTLYAGETATGTVFSWMVNTTYENGPWLGQWFVSRSLDNSPVNHAFVIRQRLSSGPTWRAELRRDRNGNTAIVGLDIPWGQHGTSASFQSSPFANQWSVGFDYAVPNGLPK
jgi:hypothetical protein